MNLKWMALLRVLTACVVTWFPAVRTAAGSPVSAGTPVPAYSVIFEENRGQAAPEVRYVARNHIGTAAGAITMQFHGADVVRFASSASI